EIVLRRTRLRTAANLCSCRRTLNFYLKLAARWLGYLGLIDAQEQPTTHRNRDRPVRPDKERPRRPVVADSSDQRAPSGARDTQSQDRVLPAACCTLGPNACLIREVDRTGSRDMQAVPGVDVYSAVGPGNIAGNGNSLAVGHGPKARG